jgi:hypothetical protein
MAMAADQGDRYRNDGLVAHATSLAIAAAPTPFVKRLRR